MSLEMYIADKYSEVEKKRVISVFTFKDKKLIKCEEVEKSEMLF